MIEVKSIHKSFENQEVLKGISALFENGKTNLILQEFPGLNHLFQHCETGAPAEYATIEETISEEVLERIAEFVKGIEK